MNEERNKQNYLIDTTDCLEAVGVFRGWKNFLFVIVACGLLLLQVSFWLVSTGCVETKVPAGTPVAAKNTEKDSNVTEQTVSPAVEVNEAAKQVVAAEPNQMAKASPKEQKQPSAFVEHIKFKHLSRLIRFLNFMLIPATALYCLTMLFALKVSMVGRLGGINHIGRAFFLSLVVFVLLLPWQLVFAPVIAGVMYTPQELLSACTAAGTAGPFGKVFYYLRFTGYWLVVLLLLLSAQLRSARWAKAILRRLEVM
jgi:hypothetical protein